MQTEGESQIISLLPTLLFFPPSQNPSSPSSPLSSHIPQINYLLYPRVLQNLVCGQSLLHISHQQLGDQRLCLRGNTLPLLKRQNNACTCRPVQHPPGQRLLPCLRTHTLHSLFFLTACPVIQTRSCHFIPPSLPPPSHIHTPLPSSSLSGPHTHILLPIYTCTQSPPPPPPHSPHTYLTPFTALSLPPTTVASTMTIKGRVARQHHEQDDT